VFESSKSAMNTFAPEFSALMIIFRSTGPVISTRRSSNSFGIDATEYRQSTKIPCTQATCLKIKTETQFLTNLPERRYLMPEQSV